MKRNRNKNKREKLIDILVKNHLHTNQDLSEPVVRKIYEITIGYLDDNQIDEMYTEAISVKRKRKLKKYLDE